MLRDEPDARFHYLFRTVRFAANAQTCLICYPLAPVFLWKNGITRYARTEQAVAGKAQYTLVVMPHNRAAQIMPTINEP